MKKDISVGKKVQGIVVSEDGTKTLDGKEIDVPPGNLKPFTEGKIPLEEIEETTEKQEKD